MQRIVPATTPSAAHALHSIAATRAIETRALAALPDHALMQRAGLAVARLALALAPHAQTLWIACGPGNNGGDGAMAADHLRQWNKTVLLTRPGEAPPERCDFAIDALLGIGANRAPEGALAAQIERLNALHDLGTPVLAVDLPSGLHADTGTGAGIVVRADHSLCLLTLKPGLFTAQGRDAAGEVWFDDLGVDASLEAPVARLNAAPRIAPRPHATHKGSFGDVAVIGGDAGMGGAALLAARAALHGGAGRVYVGLLDGSLSIDPTQPELMLRPVETLDVKTMTVVCGCGGGDAVRAQLPRLLASASRLVLDADALNAIATDSQLQTQLHARAARGMATVLTPHPLEAARLSGGEAAGMDTARIQHDRLQAAQTLAAQFQCVVVLKGSGTVIAAPGKLPAINPTGNARLATAGTGDVLAGYIGALLAQGMPAFEAACAAVYRHGQIADAWPDNRPESKSLTAKALACAWPSPPLS